MSAKKQEPLSQSEADPSRAIDKRPQPQRKTKRALLLELIGSEGGATLEELTSATGWLPHTARAAITGLRKQGHEVQCQRVDGVGRYTMGSDSE
jgi:hypothetical protein